MKNRKLISENDNENNLIEFQINPAMKSSNGSINNFQRSFSIQELGNLTLHQAAREGDVQLMEKLLDRIQNPLQKKKKINSLDESQFSPLHYAARYNHYKIIGILIDNGADVEILGEDNATPLHYLAKYKKKINEDDIGHGDTTRIAQDYSKICIKMLVENGANVNAQDIMGVTPLHQACLRNNVKAVAQLVKVSSIDIEAADNQGLTALHYACSYSRMEIVEMLLDAGASMLSRDKDQSTPLHLTCAEGSEEVALLLFDKARSMEKATPLYEETVFTTVSETNNTLPRNSVSEQLQSNSSNEHSFYNLKKQLFKSAESLNVIRRSTFSLLTKTKDCSCNVLDLLQCSDAMKNIPLHLAIENGHFNMVKLCINEGNDAGWNDMVKARRLHEESCLPLATHAKNFEIIKLLVNEGLDIDARNALSVTPLMYSCQQNAYDVVEFFLENGANMEMRNSDLMTPLMIACRFGHIETIKILLNHGADIHATDKNERTSFMLAAEENKIAVLELLLNHFGTSLVEEKDKFNNTALHLAAMKGHNEAVELLLEHQAAIDIRNDDDRTTLHMAAFHGHNTVMPHLLKTDQSVINAGDEESNTALHLAAIGKNIKCVNILIDCGANLESRNARHWTPLDCAAAYGSDKIVQALLRAGANFQPLGKVKITPLHLACQKGHVSVVKTLLKWKVDVAFKASDGRNALDFAIDFEQKECVLALIKHETWLKSMRNAYFNPMTGLLVTPMRKLIMKMEDMAIVVCDQCITDNDMKPEDDDYKVSLLYEFLDDMYSSSEWLNSEKENIGNAPENVSLINDESRYKVYDDNDELSSEAQTYTDKTEILQMNHPLKTMVAYESEKLLLHPVVAGLLHHKWTHFGRYVYYTNLLLFITYLFMLNCYMLLQPPFYKLNWVKLVQFRHYLMNGRNPTGLNITAGNLSQFIKDSPACLYYRMEVIENSRYHGEFTDTCVTISPSVRNLKWPILIIAVFNLIRQIVALYRIRQVRFGFSNLVEISLYISTISLVIDFPTYTIYHVALLTASRLNQVEPLIDFQTDTGLRQQWQEHLGALAMFLSWVVLLLQIRKFPRFGIFVVMFTDVLKTFTEFFVIFILFICAFGFSFNLLIGNQVEFRTWYESIFKTMVMTVNGIDYGGIFFSASTEIDMIGVDYPSQIYSREITLVLSIIFVLVMTILIVNLLVGLAVGDIIEIQQQATLKRLGMQVDLVLGVEFALPNFLKRKICKRKRSLCVHKHHRENIFSKYLKFFTGEESLSKNIITKSLEKEEDDADHKDLLSVEERTASELGFLRGHLTDVISEQMDLKHDLKAMEKLIKEIQKNSSEQAEKIHQSIGEVNTSMSANIISTRSGLMETTQKESEQIRNRVEGTLSTIITLKADLENKAIGVKMVKDELEGKIQEVHSEILSGNWQEMNSKMEICLQELNSTKQDIMQALFNLRSLFPARSEGEANAFADQQLNRYRSNVSQDPHSIVQDQVEFYENITHDQDDSNQD